MNKPDERRNLHRFPLVKADTADIDGLVAIIRRLSIAHSLEEVMEVVTHSTRSLLGADGITFVLREGEFCHYAAEDAISPLWKGKRFPMTACISGWCMTEGRSAVIPDIDKDPRIPHDAYEPTFVKSLAMVPVRQEAPIAAIGAYWAYVREITQLEVELLQTIANSAALAVANIQLAREQRKMREAEERLQLLAREVDHRAKNLLAVVHGMVRFTRAPTVREFVAALVGRIQSLARAQEVMSKGHWEGADLTLLVEEQLAPFSGGEANRVAMEGPRLSIAPLAAQSVAIALHELATNGSKYGALSVRGGRVEITWEVDQKGWLCLRWRETGGPAVKKPSRRGLGTTIIERMFRTQLHGQVRFDWGSAGLLCEIRIPPRSWTDSAARPD